MSNKNQDLPRGYILLWVIVIIFALFVFISHMIFFVGQGRWVCTEYKTRCEKCEIEGTRIVKVDQQVIEMNWKTENPNMCYCTEYKQECTKEVWTRE